MQGLGNKCEALQSCNYDKEIASLTLTQQQWQQNKALQYMFPPPDIIHSTCVMKKDM